MLEAVRRWLRKVGNRIGEAGYHHMLVALAFSLPAAFIATEAWALLSLIWTAYYWGREDGWEQIAPWIDYAGTGRLTDVAYVAVYALVAVLVAVLA